jgi:hypothetical protein
MFLLYVDESGTPESEDQNYFVLGAVAIYETQAFYLSRNFDNIQDKWFPASAESVEFHSANIRNRNEVFRKFKVDEGKQIFSDLCNSILGISDKALTLFGIAIHKASFPTDDPIEKAFYELCGHFDVFVKRINESGMYEKNRALMILDSSKYSGHLDKLLLGYQRHGGTKFGRVYYFADAPAFANSGTSRLLQAADLVAYSLYRYYEKNDTFLFNELVDRFDQSEGIYHGLTHMIPAAQRDKCPCVACLSRRIKQQT